MCEIILMVPGVGLDFSIDPNKGFTELVGFVKEKLWGFRVSNLYLLISLFENFQTLFRTLTQPP